MPRPKAHYNAKGCLRPSAPLFHSNKGDVDKLVRACGDALTKVSYDDDALIVGISALKVFCRPSEGPGVFVKISRLEEEAAAAAMRATEF